MTKYREGKGVEGNRGIYDRVQKLKELLKNELDEETKKFVQADSKNKILVVTHSRVLQSFSAKGIQKVEGPMSSVGPDELIDARYFQNCEIMPYKSD